ncbi:MAG: deoxyribose-phosphate aldolase [Clostridia bacterium]|nr:deoxyribose-phosphate aldolase [Clostridia bacterium]MBQ5772016.1 deoxyribose-phosphate aldolase [Clostridia bacterium]
MELKTILSRVDHTLLSQSATWEEIKAICEDGIRYGTASVCIPASFVAKAAEFSAGRIPICTVIGFPNGYSTTAVKVFETRDAVQNGADEIDMVINIGWVKEGRYDAVLEEIKCIREACRGKILKVIIETCLLTEEEKIRMCEVVNASGADYIKTSTGFSKAGATPEDIAIFARYSAPHVKIKAAGGIRSLADAENYIALGASRLGTSSIVKLAKGQENANGGY